LCTTLGFKVTDRCLGRERLKRRPETTWLAEVSNVVLQQALRHLDQAFRNFFAGRARYPAFKRKRGPQSATNMKNGFTWRRGELTLAKVNKPLDFRFSRRFSDEPSSVTVRKDAAERYFVSFVVEEDIQPLPGSRRRVGIDLGLTDTVVTSDGERFSNQRFFRKEDKRLKRAQQRLAKKRKGSRNREKARIRVARIHARIEDRRVDFLHKLTTDLISQLRYKA
jgi:putative transposase